MKEAMKLSASAGSRRSNNRGRDNGCNIARNKAAETALLDAFSAARSVSCTEIIMGQGALDFLYAYFKGHHLISTKGVGGKVKVLERRRNLFQALVWLAERLRTFKRSD